MDSIAFGNLARGLAQGKENRRRWEREDAQEGRLAAEEERNAARERRAEDAHALNMVATQGQIDERKQRMERSAWELDLRKRIEGSELKRSAAMSQLNLLIQEMRADPEGFDPGKLSQFYRDHVPDGKEGIVIRSPDGMYVLQATDNSFSMPLGRTLEEVGRTAYSVVGDPMVYYEHVMAGEELRQRNEASLANRRGVLDLEFADDQRRAKEFGQAPGRGGASGAGGTRTYATERRVEAMVQSGIPRHVAVQIAEGAETPLEAAQGLLQSYLDIALSGSSSEKRQLAQSLGIQDGQLSFSALKDAAIKQAQEFMSDAAGPDPSDELGFRRWREGGGKDNDPQGLRGLIE